MNEYQEGIEYYRKGGYLVTGETYSAKFLNGFFFEERHSHCGQMYVKWV